MKALLKILLAVLFIASAVVAVFDLPFSSFAVRIVAIISCIISGEALFYKGEADRTR